MGRGFHVFVCYLLYFQPDHERQQWCPWQHGLWRGVHLISVFNCVISLLLSVFFLSAFQSLQLYTTLTFLSTTD